MLAKGINVIMENKYVYFISREGIELSTEKGFQWSVWPKSAGPEGHALGSVNQAVPVCGECYAAHRTVGSNGRRDGNSL